MSDWAAAVVLAAAWIAIAATDEVIGKADEITDAIEETVPGGIVINRVVDFVLVPGRCIRIARSVLSAGPTGPAYTRCVPNSDELSIVTVTRRATDPREE
jgi:hypothetical protein